MIKKIALALLISASYSTASDLYTDTYLSNSGIVYPHINTGIDNHVNGDTLMNKKRVFSRHMYFKDGALTVASQNALEEIERLIKKRGSRPYFVSLIGHTSYFTDEHHFTDMNAWSKFWQNLGKKEMSREDLAQSVNNRIKAIYNMLDENGVNTTKVYTENRMNRDPLATEETSEGMLINQRVDMVLYY